MKILTFILIIASLITLSHTTEERQIPDLAAQITNTLWGLHNWNRLAPVQVANFLCTPSIKGRVRRLKWVWDGRVACVGPAAITGSSRGQRSRSGAIHHALRNFVAIAVSQGHLTNLN